MKEKPFRVTRLMIEMANARIMGKIPQGSWLEDELLSDRVVIRETGWNLLRRRGFPQTFRINRR